MQDSGQCPIFGSSSLVVCLSTISRASVERIIPSLATSSISSSKNLVLFSVMISSFTYPPIKPWWFLGLLGFFLLQNHVSLFHFQSYLHKIFFLNLSSQAF